MAFGRPERDRFVRFIHGSDSARFPRGPPNLPDSAVVAALMSPTPKTRPDRLKTPVRRAIVDYIRQPTFERQDLFKVRRMISDFEQRHRDTNSTPSFICGNSQLHTSQTLSSPDASTPDPPSIPDHATKAFTPVEPGARANTPATPLPSAHLKSKDTKARANTPATPLPSAHLNSKEIKDYHINKTLPWIRKQGAVTQVSPESPHLPLLRKGKMCKTFTPGISGYRANHKEDDEILYSKSMAGKIIFSRGQNSPDSRRQELLFSRPINGSIQAGVYSQSKPDLLKPLIVCQYAEDLGHVDSVDAFVRSQPVHFSHRLQRKNTVLSSFRSGF